MDQDLPKLKSQNPSVVLHGVGDLRFEVRSRPEPDANEAVVAVMKTGICGSDVHYLCHARIGNFIMREPMCLGHESAGIVVKIGAGDGGLCVGDRVALEPGVGCGVCDVCQGGKYELCAKMKFAATPPSTTGTLARYYALPTRLLHRLPDTVSYEEGAMMEPLSVGVHSVSTLGKCASGQVVCVFGAGPIGLLCMAVAKALGASRVIAIDVLQNKLDFARLYAASETFLPPVRNEDETSEDYAVRLVDLMTTRLSLPRHGLGAVDLVIEASGAPTCVQMGCGILRPGGRYVQVGLGSQTSPPMPLFQVVSKELVVLGSFRYGPGAYQKAISLVARGLVDVQPLVTQRYSFLEAQTAFEATKSGKDAHGNVVIKCIIDGPLEGDFFSK